jgi:hypothetical protein
LIAKVRKVAAAVACPRKPALARAVLVGLLLSLIPISSFGQRYRSFRDQRDDIINTAKYRVGFFFITPSLGLRDVGLDNNVYYEREEQGPVSDYTFTVFATARISYIYQRWMILSVTENPEYVYYFEQGKERGWNNLISPELKLFLLHRLALSGSYSNTKTRYRATAEFNERVDVYREGYRGSLFFETPRGTSIGVSGSTQDVRYGNAPELSNFNSLNRKEQDAKFEMYYRIGQEKFLFWNGGYSEYRFKDPLYRWRDAYSYQTSAGIQFPLLGRIRGALSLGYKQLTPRDVSKQGFSGLVGDTSLDIRVSRFAFRLGFTRDSYFSYWQDNVYFIGNQAGTGVSFYATKFLRLDYDFNFGTYDYPEPGIVRSPSGELELIQRSDDFRSHVAGFVIRVVKNTGVGLMVNSWTRRSNVSTENRTRTFWGAYVTYEF